MIDHACGYACWLIQDGDKMEEFAAESIVEPSPPMSTRVKAVSTSRLSAVSTAAGGSVASTSVLSSQPRPPYTAALPILRCYVQAQPQSEFVVHFEEIDSAVERIFAVEVLLDGKFARGRFVRHSHEKAVFNISRRSGEGSSATSPLEFPDFQDMEETLDAAGSLGHLGTVCVDVWKGRSRETTDQLASRIMTTADAEDVLTPRPLRGCAPVFLRGGTAFDPLLNFEFEERLIRFEFRYRTPGYLSHCGIKPPRIRRRIPCASAEKKAASQDRQNQRVVATKASS
eukprot:Protomagalhaensia_sp_Gyna_25__2411@NODE_233_length_4248_cov_42_627227_g174_i1_p3_GENE_NODE_233_length_4248_cov_42_627227_g174_i1NODE_233_length_4248_cov_42_627227_g174_i1_p3_ORF_typecomplete_len285_score27_65_NODE_233_length_4248_cov_42_627227_g174_i115212375